MSRSRFPRNFEVQLKSLFNYSPRVVSAIQKDQIEELILDAIEPQDNFRQIRLQNRMRKNPQKEHSRIRKLKFLLNQYISYKEQTGKHLAIKN